MVSSQEYDQSGLIKSNSTKMSFKLTRSRMKWSAFFVCLVLGLLALIGIIIYTELYIHSHHIRIDCNPDLPLNYKKCLDRGCLWVQRSEDEPSCFFPNGYGYQYLNISNTSSGYHVDLKRKEAKRMFGDEVQLVDLIVSFETDKRIRLKFLDKSQERYEVPLEVPEIPLKAAEKMDYDIDFVNEPQFGIKIKRIATGNIIFDTCVPGMIYSNQFIQITTKLASSNIYGLGEHLSYQYKISTKLKRMSFFARDAPPIDDSNIYGVHPFYINVEDDGNAHGVFFLNSNAMEMFLQPYPSLTFRTIGGILDFYVFLGPTPEMVVQQYLEVIGLPLMPPYWGLGFQLSRYGYKSVEDVKSVVKRTIENKIPYDVQYLDIDYMKDFRSFTIDDKTFGSLGSFVDELHEKGIKVILILDPFISSNMTLKGSYPALDEGLAHSVFIKINGSILEGNCWPGNVYYPDFSHPNALSYWSKLCSDLRSAVDYDGLWIDMNEPSNFVEGSLSGCERNSLNYPPYAAGVSGSEKDGKLFEKTICMDAVQYAGKHYDVHSLYGFFQANVTFRSLNDNKNRPLVLSRSTYPGSGRYAAHWLGDNFATWLQLRASIPGILQFNTFGIPFVGSDICGFWLNTTEELCSRWMQLGAFYPFSRNHNGLGCIDQDPASMSANVINASRVALLTRYELLPYLYTLFHMAHVEGATVARPLLHEFPKDRKTWDINYQFLWGPALLISPIVYEGAKSVEAYFPEGIWYDFYTGSIFRDGKGEMLTLPDQKKINLHVRGGFILPMQKPVVTTTESRKQPMGLFVAPNINGTAKGLLFWDDGISYETQTSGKFLLLNFLYQSIGGNAQLSSNVSVNGYIDAGKVKFGYMILCKQSAEPRQIVLNSKILKPQYWKYLNKEMVLQLQSLDIPINENFSLTINY